MRRFTRRSVLLVCVLAAVGTGAAGGGDDRSPDSAPPESTESVPPDSAARSVEQRKFEILADPNLEFEVDEFARQHQVSKEVAARALALLQSQIELAPKMRAALPDLFAGIWFDQSDMKTINVGIRSESSEADEIVASIAAQLGVQGHVTVVPTKYSLRELEVGIDELEDVLSALPQRAGAILPTTGISLSKNRVVLHREPQLEDSRASDTVVAAAEAGLGGMLTVEYDDARVAAGGCVFPYCDPPLRSGIAIGSETGTLCSGGFLARSRSDGKLYQLTAGHCTGVGVLWRTEESDGTLHTIGRTHSRDDGDFTGVAEDGDSAIIAVHSNTFWRARAWVFVTTGDHTTPNTQYPIYYRGNAGVDSWVCRSGRANSTTCGWVREVNDCYTDSRSDVRRCRLHRVALSVEDDRCNVAGNSGGPVFSRSTAWGIYSGGSVSACSFFFDPTFHVENRRNVNVSIDQG